VRYKQIQNFQQQINDLEKSKPPKNRWDYFGVITLILFILLGIYLIRYSFYLTIGSIFIGIIFFEKVSEKARKEKQPFFDNIRSRVNQIENDRESLLTRVRKLYEQFWNIPPDWSWRREQVIQRDEYKCQSCGRKYYGSKVPFHVHHIIPKSQRDGSHRIENLQLLCEICHGKSETQGHHLVKEARKKRLMRNKYK